MASSFLIPIIAWLPRGYDCTVVMPPEALAGRLLNGGGRLIRDWRVVVGGEPVAADQQELVFEEGRQVAGPPSTLTWSGAASGDWPIDGGYLEYGIRAADEAPLFRNDKLPSFYNVYKAEGRKSFFACHTWKFGSPQVISQIAQYGRYVDAYPAIRIDRDRDLGDSLVLINPYHKPIVADLMTQDGRRAPRLRIPPLAARWVSLAEVIAGEGEDWLGQIQLTANNRLVTYIVKHSLADPERISTVEHLDPYRADPTHYPLTRWLRLKVGFWRHRKGWG